MASTIKFIVSVRTDCVGSECQEEVEFDRDEWEAMTPEQRESELREVVWNMAEWSYAEV